MRPGFVRFHHDSSACPVVFEPLEARQLCAVDLGGSLVAHWTFEDPTAAPAQFADVSPETTANHPASRFGDARQAEPQTGNHTLQLDGNGDYLTVPNAADLNLGIHDQRSIAFWFRADDVSISSRKQIIYEEGGTTRGLVIYVYDQQLYVGGWNTPGSESGWAGTWLSTPGITSGRWHHVALTLDGQATTTDTALSGYLDGQRFAQGVGSQLWSRSGSITVGNHSDGTRFHDGNVATLTAGFAGQLDDGRIYNRTLQPADVRLLARGPATPTPPMAAGLRGLSVHEITYTQAPDSAVDANEATPPQRLHDRQTPDFPGRALIAAPSSSVNAAIAPAPLEPLDLSQVWSGPLALWPTLSAWLADHADDAETATARAEASDGGVNDLDAAEVSGVADVDTSGRPDSLPMR